MRQMYFGTKKRMTWIKTHAPNSPYAMLGSSERLDLSNGGVALRESENGHMEYTLTWNVMTRAQARQVTDYAYGIYGSDPIHFVDPVAMDQNVLNKAWSAPGLTAKDAVPLAGNKRPTLVSNLDLSRDCPAEMAAYTLTATDTSRSFYVAIPPGHTASVSVRGDAASTLGVTVQPTVSGVSSGSATTLPVEDMGAAPAVALFPASSTQAGIELSIETGTAGTITLGALMVQIHPTGITPNHTRWISGQGASGLKFEGKAQPVPYSLPADIVGLSVKLTEIEDWL